MKKFALFILLLTPLCTFSQLDIVITTNHTPLFPQDGDTLSVCRGDTIKIKAVVTDGGIPATNVTYNWDFDNGITTSYFNIDSVNIIYETEAQDIDPYGGGGGFRIKLNVIDESLQEGFTIIPVKVALPPNFSETKVDLPEGQIGICKGSSAKLVGKAYSEIWEDEPEYIYPESFFGEPFDDTDPYERSLNFDEFDLGTTYISGDIDSIGLDIIHPELGDLKISLSCKTGNTVILKDFDPGNSTILGDTLNNTSFQYYFKEISTNGLMNDFTSGTVPEGTYQSEQSLDNLIGCPMNGDWTLKIEDSQFPDSGKVFAWDITFSEQALPPVWTFRDTLVEYIIVDDIPIGTYWSGENIAPSQVIISGDSVLHNAVCIPPDSYDTYQYDFHTVTNWGCAQDTNVYVKVENALVDPENGGGEAKLEITFQDLTSWSISRDWSFDDGVDSLGMFKDSVTHEYLEKGEYECILTAYDKNGCFDTDTSFVSVEVEPSHLKNVPNAFTPNKDGINDRWYLEEEEKLKGMKEFHLTIYNRWGEKVFESYSQEEMNNPEGGWNGNIMNRDNDIWNCPSGIYFYVIKAVGKNEIEYKPNRGPKKNQQTDDQSSQEVDATKGLIHLFRGEKNPDTE